MYIDGVYVNIQDWEIWAALSLLVIAALIGIGIGYISIAIENKHKGE